MGNKKETTYKLGNLPFMFLSREHYGPYTIFKNGDNVELRIKTEMLDKNKSIVKTQQFSMLEDLVSRAERAIVQSGKQDQVTITIDNVNSIVISDTNTENEVVIDPSSETAETEMRGALADVGIVNFGFIKNAFDKYTLLTKSGKDLYNDFYVIDTIKENYLGRTIQTLKDIASRSDLLDFVGISKKSLKHIYEGLHSRYQILEKLENKIGSKTKFKAVQNVVTESDAINIESKHSKSDLEEQIRQYRKLNDAGKLDSTGKRKLREAIEQYTKGNFSTKNFDDKDNTDLELDAGTFAPRTEHKVGKAAATLLAKLTYELTRTKDKIDKLTKGGNVRTQKIQSTLEEISTFIGDKTKQKSISYNLNDIISKSKLTESDLGTALTQIKDSEKSVIDETDQKINDFFKNQGKQLLEEAKQDTTDSEAKVNEDDLDKVLSIVFGKKNQDKKNNFKSMLTSDKDLKPLASVLSEFTKKPYREVLDECKKTIKNTEKLSDKSKQGLMSRLGQSAGSLNKLSEQSTTDTNSNKSSNSNKIDIFSEKRNFGSTNNKIQVKQVTYKIFGGSEDKCKQWAKAFKAKDLVNATYNRLLNQNDKTKKNFETALSDFVKKNPSKQQVANLIQTRTEAYIKNGTNQLLFSSNNVYGLADTLLANFAKNKEGWVKDSENGRVYQDKYGTQWSSDKPDATPVFESKDGKDDPRNFKPEEDKDEGDATMSEDEMDDVLGMGDESGGDDDDLFGGDESDSGDDIFSDDESSDSGDDDLFGGDDSDSGSGDDMFSEDDDDIFGDDSGSDDDDLFGDSEEEGSEDDDFGFGDEDLETEEDTDMTSKQAIETIGDIAMKLIDKLK